ncbi:MAG: carbohydrate binding domain-containing protein [Candidatus Omnitrophota bacterium]|nr:carbohydrate binding domain-containing protein [Candidatus Omnitrophota bacterium]
MNTHLKTVFMVTALLVSLLFLSGGSEAVSVDRSVTVNAEAAVPIVPGSLMDDFDQGIEVNSWNGATGTFAEDGSTATCEVSYPSSNDPSNPTLPGKCLKLDFDVNDSASYAGYYSSFGGGSIGSYANLSFYVKGSVSGIFFKIELKNTSTATYWSAAKSTNYYRNKSFVYITDYLDGGVTTSWKKVTIPLKNFANLDGISSMSQLTIVFENSQSDTNGSPKQGTLYIDNIALDTNPVPAVRVDHYGDMIGTCALGANMGDGGGSGGSMTHEYSLAAAHTYTRGLQLNYNTGDYGWAYTYTVFGGGNDAVERPDQSGYIDIPVDMSAYTNLTFLVKAKSDGENPRGIKVELKDTSYSTFYRIAYNAPNRITTDWQKITIPLADFKDGANTLRKDQIKQLVFTFENWNSVKHVGIVYIDEVQFE